jgi:chromosome segregation ATPase
LTGSRTPVETGRPDTASILSRQVDALQTRLAERELRGQWYLDRIRQLEAFIGSGARTIPTMPGAADGRSAENGHRKDGPTRIGRSTRDVRALERQVAGLSADLRQKEITIAELAGAAAERLAAAEQAGEEIGRLHEEVGRYGDDLRAKDRAIAELAAAAEERGRHLEESVAESARLRESIGLLSHDLAAKDAVIAELATAAEQRLVLLEAATAEMDRLRAAIQELAASRLPALDGGAPAPEHVEAPAQPEATISGREQT